MNGSSSKKMEDKELFDITGDFTDLKFPESKSKKKAFKPWHHPRKQWVRAKHWCNHTEKLIKKLRTNKSKVLTYLTLPGEDLLDIREIRGTCERNGFSLRYLGFNTAYATSSTSEIEINHHDLMAMNSVHHDSQIATDKIELVAKESSVAYQHFNNAGPFDVINIDLCNSIAIHSASNDSITYYDMIKSVMDYQFKFRTDSWLLFISSSVSSVEINESAISAFIKIVKENIEGSEEFHSKLKNILTDENFNLENIFNDKVSLQLVSVFGISFCKWLISICLSHSPKWLLHLDDICHYNIQDGESKMISFAIRFEREIIQVPDKHGLAKDIYGYSKSEVSLNEITLAISALDKISKILDLDDYLASQADLMNRMKLATADLLELVRYNKNDYFNWCQTKHSL